MGLTKKQYRRLVEEFQRSGILGSVNTHAFNASGRNLTAKLDPDAGMFGKAAYSLRAAGRWGYNKAARIGFEWGERNNLTFTYLVALKRIQKKYDIEDLTKLSREQWKEIAAEADGLALGMTRPNKFSYQAGATGMLFQFLSFQHRAALTMFGLNPKIQGADVFKIWGSGILLWGTNILGLEEWTNEFLAHHGLEDWGQIPIGDGINIKDALVSGMVETALNGIIHMVNDESSDINFGILAPGAAISELYQGFYDLITAKPTELELLGPSATQAAGFGKGLALFVQPAPHWSWGEKIVRTAEFLARETLPAYNDIEKSIIAMQTGEWAKRDGDTLGIQAHAAEIAFRLGFGIRPDSELSIYRTIKLYWADQKNVDEWVRKNRDYLKIMMPKWFTGELTDQDVLETIQLIHSWTESAPEGVRREIFRRTMSEPGLEDGKSITQIVAENVGNASAVLGRVSYHVNNDTTLTHTQREQMREIVKYLQEGQHSADKAFREGTQKDLENRGLE
jgi:hypothetical protein